MTEAVRRKPYGPRTFVGFLRLPLTPVVAVILLDELEKAHKVCVFPGVPTIVPHAHLTKDVSMILLQILDEGNVTDSQGRKVDFKVRNFPVLSRISNLVHSQNTIICLTSNLGSDILAHPSSCDANGIVSKEARDLVMERTSEYFAPELLNRLDSILVFNKLSRESILEVVSLRLKDVADRLQDRRIALDVDDGAKDWLANKGYSDVYGARAIARVVRTKVSPGWSDLLVIGDPRCDS